MIRWLALMGTLLGCNALGEVAIGGVDFAGAKADAFCDRRFVTGSGRPAGFCQQIVSTVAAAEFTDDCRSKHQAEAGAGTCPRERLVAGCLLLEEHRDESVVTDWYYDVSNLQADGGGPQSAVAHTVDEVASLCADATRYEHGATLVLP